MAAPKDIDPYQSPLHFFASQLRRHRLRLDLTQEQLGRRVSYSADTVSKVGTAEANPSEDLGRACDEVFGTHGHMEHLARMVHRTAGLPTWMREWLGPEQRAHTIRYWEPLVVQAVNLNSVIQPAGDARAIALLALGANIHRPTRRRGTVPWLTITGLGG